MATATLPPLPPLQTPLADQKLVSSAPSISVGTFHNEPWIKIDGKGSFANSKALKTYCKKQLSAGKKKLVIDLSTCTGMDSTFMGTLAGLAMKLLKIEGTQFQIAGADERNAASLEDLGLDCLMQINPDEADWKNEIDSIQRTLKPYDDVAAANTQHILEAHQKLVEADGSNQEKFSTVIDVLEQQVENKTDN